MSLPLANLAPLKSPALVFDGAWKDGSILRYTPPTQVNPVERGTNYDAAYPGRGIDRKPIGGGFENISGPVTRDLLIARSLNGGGEGGGLPDGSAVPRIGRVTVEGWRHARVIGGDLTVAATGAGFLYRALPGSLSCFVEGVRADFAAGLETDACGVTGAAADSAPVFAIQDCCLLNVHGTAQAHDDGRAVTAASVAGGVMTVEASPTVPTALTPGQNFALGGAVDPAFNGTWTVVAVAVDHFTASAGGRTPMPADGAATTGGTVWAFDAATLGVHADVVQAYGSGLVAQLLVHKITATGNYDFLVTGQRIDTGLGAVDTRVSMVNFSYVSVDPQDDGGFSILGGDYDTDAGTVSARGARRAKLELYEVWHQGRPTDNFANAIIPQAGRSVDGKAFGMRVGHVLGETIASYPTNPTSEIRGVIFKGVPPGGDFTPWGSVGHDYVRLGYVEEVAEAPAAISLSGVTYVADDPRGTVIGIIDAPGYGGGAVLDVTLVDDAGGRVQVVANELQRGPTPDDGSTFDVTLRATVRSSGAWFEQTHAITCLPAVAPAYGAMSDPDAVNFVRALYGYDDLSGGDLAFFDGLFTAWKAINGGAFWPKLKAWFSSAMLDERDAELNWIAPSAARVHPYGYQKAWTANVGYVGNPGASGSPPFYMSRPGFTAPSLGLGQDDCALMICASIKAPDAADGALPTGTEYFAGANNTTGDGFGGLYIGALTTGQITCKCSNTATKTTPATPFLGTGGAMRHVFLTRTAASSFVICYGAKGVALTVDTTTAAPAPSSTSVPLTTFDMRLSGRGGATSNAGSRTLHAVAFLTGITAAEANAFRAVNDTWLDYLGIA